MTDSDFRNEDDAPTADKPRMAPILLLALAAGLCVTGFIECWQLLVGRAFDIDDLWLNTLGAFCGFWIWCLLDRAAPGWTRRFRVRQIQD